MHCWRLSLVCSCAQGESLGLPLATITLLATFFIHLAFPFCLFISVRNPKYSGKLYYRGFWAMPRWKLKLTNACRNSQLWPEHLIGGLSKDDGDGNENGETKQQLCTCTTLFCTFLSRRCRTTWLEVPNLNFTFCRGRQHKTITFFLFSS